MATLAAGDDFIPIQNPVYQQVTLQNLQTLVENVKGNQTFTIVSSGPSRDDTQASWLQIEDLTTTTVQADTVLSSTIILDTGTGESSGQRRHRLMMAAMKRWESGDFSSTPDTTITEDTGQLTDRPIQANARTRAGQNGQEAKEPTTSDDGAQANVCVASLSTW